MSNHARGLWGYSGITPSGHEITIQATGMGGPSAAIVLSDLAKLGMRRGVRVGTCTARDPAIQIGDLLLVEAAIATGGSSPAFGVEAGESVSPDAGLTSRLRGVLANVIETTVASIDSTPEDLARVPAAANALDMQTVATFGRAQGLGIEIAGLLIVTEDARAKHLPQPDLEAAAKVAGSAAAAVLST